MNLEGRRGTLEAIELRAKRFYWPEWPIAALTSDNVNIDIDLSGNSDIPAGIMRFWGALFLLRALLFAAVLSSLVSAG